MKRHALWLSHLAMMVIGALLARPSSSPPLPDNLTSAPNPVATAPPSKGSVADRPAKLARAGGAAYRAAWDEALLGPRSELGEPRLPDSIGFFMDWCEVDPDGAIRALSKSYAPRFSHNFLNNAVGKHGVILAPVLVKRFRDLELIPDYKVNHAMGRCLHAVAKEDPERAAALLAELPTGRRSDIFDDLFGGQDRGALDRLMAAMPEPRSEIEVQRRNENYVDAIDRTDMERALWDGWSNAEDPALRQAFADHAVTKARRIEDWTAFFDVVERLDGGARDQARDALEKQRPSDGYPAAVREAISAECRRRGLEDWSSP